MSKVFRFFKRKESNTPVPVVELIIDAPVYEQLKKRAHTEGISENDVLLGALRRGMSDYWLHVVKYERERYQLVEKLFEQAKRDNELLEAIINQNVRFREIWEIKKSKGKSTVGENENPMAGNFK